MDVNRLLAEAIARHGVKLDANDPAMVIVTLNRLMLEATGREIADEIREATKEFEAAGERIQKGVGAAIAREVARNSEGQPRFRRDMALLLAGLLVLSLAVGFLLGRRL
jgi:hypothetical protein